MNNPFIRPFFVCFAVVLVLFGATANAALPSDDAAAIETGILSAFGIADIREWIDSELTDSAGSTAEWYVFALAQKGDYDFSRYQASLFSFLSTHQVYSATSRQKYALVLAATGSEDPYITQTLRDSIGVQGHMSWVFGLHFYNNGYRIPEFTAEDLIASILSRQLTDGGFAVIGDRGDPDVTAMTLQALAPHLDRGDVRGAVDRALAYLSATQLENGGFFGMGKDNLESCAQVLLALSELGIDFENDARFLKDGNSVFDSLLRFRLPDGTFSHTPGGEFNRSATVQAFYTAVALQRRERGLRFYDLDKAKPAVIEKWQDLPGESAVTPVEEEEEDHSPSFFSLPKILIVSGAFLIALSLSLFVILSKKGRKKDLVLIWGVFLILGAGILFLRFQSKEEFYSEDTRKGEKIGIVMISIRCDTVLDHREDLDPALRSDEFVPPDGAIFPVTLVDLYRGDSVFDLLDRVCRREKIHLEVIGASESRLGSVYVEGIHHLYETSCGPLSGWMYRVNDVFPFQSSSEYFPNDGDVIVWAYTCDLGHDLGNFYRGEAS